jgi:hypothetical protein
MDNGKWIMRKPNSPERARYDRIGCSPMLSNDMIYYEILHNLHPTHKKNVKVLASNDTNSPFKTF